MAEYNLSASTLNLFRDCPRCFWLAINKNIRRPRGPYPSIASGLDSVIKNYYEIYRDKMILPPILEQKIKGRLIRKLPKTLYFNDYKSNVLLYGHLDECIITEDGFYAALDHKTRGSVPEEVHPSYKLQMDVYTLLLENNNYKTKNVAYIVYYTPEVGLLHEGFPFKIKVFEINTQPQKAENILYEAIDVLKKGIPAADLECEYCNWAGKQFEIDK